MATERHLLENLPERYAQPQKVGFPVLLCHGVGVIVILLKCSHMQRIANYYQHLGVSSFAPHVTPYASIEQRATEWSGHIQTILQQTKAEKIHLVGHSMGGLDIRRLAHEPELKGRIASLHLVSTPNRGSALADIHMQLPNWVTAPAVYAANQFANRIHKAQKSDTLEAMENLRPHFLAAFNERYPDQADIPTYSYPAVIGPESERSAPIGVNILNHLLYKKEGKNDGFVSVDSARWGKTVDVYTLAHQEQITFGLSGQAWTEYYRLWWDVLQRMIESEA